MRNHFLPAHDTTELRHFTITVTTKPSEDTFKTFLPLKLKLIFILNCFLTFFATFQLVKVIFLNKKTLIRNPLLDFIKNVEPNIQK